MSICTTERNEAAATKERTGSMCRKLRERAADYAKFRLQVEGIEGQPETWEERMRLIFEGGGLDDATNRTIVDICVVLVCTVRLTRILELSGEQGDFLAATMLVGDVLNDRRVEVEFGYVEDYVDDDTLNDLLDAAADDRKAFYDAALLSWRHAEHIASLSKTGTRWDDMPIYLSDELLLKHSPVDDEAKSYLLQCGRVADGGDW